METINTITIYNQLGQVVMIENHFNTSIDISSLNQGIYVIEIVTPGTIFKNRLVVE